MLKVVHDASASNEAAGGSLLDEIVRDGARQMLAAALQAEVAVYVEAFAGELDENGHRLVVRNGFHEPREVTTAAGAIPVRAPRVNDKRTDEATGQRTRFASAILPAWARKSPRVAEVLPLLYLHGLSSGDFGPALTQFLGTSHGALAGDHHPADEGLARRGGRVQPAVPGRDRLRVRVGRRDPPEGPPRAGQGVPAGDDRRARRRH